MPNNVAEIPFIEQAPLTGNIAGIPSSEVNVNPTYIPVPITKPEEYNPQYDLTKQNLSNVLNDISSKLPDSGIMVPFASPQEEAKRYSSAGTFNPLSNNEEIAAQNQSWYSKWGHGLAKLGVLGVGSFAESLLQVPDLIAGSKDGAIWKSDWFESIDNLIKNSEDVFPNYYTQWEKDHPFKSIVPFSGGGANFWADKFAKNLGFTIGAIGGAVVEDLAIGAATEGIGEIPLIGAQVGKASLYLSKLFTGTNRLEEVLNTARTLNKSDQTLLTIENMATASESARIGKGARYMTALATSANTEAGMEARQGYHQIKHDLTTQYTQDHGYAPIGADANKIEQYATSGGNVRYALNMGLLSISNAVQFEAILKPWNAYKQAMKGGIEATTEEQVGKIGLQEATPKVGADIDNLAVQTEKVGKIGRVWNVIKPTIPAIFSEGVFEEGGQYAVERGVDKYFKDKYNGKNVGDLNAILKNIGYGLSEQFYSTEGWENIILGGLTGAFMHPIESFVENKQRKNAGVLSPQEATQAAKGNLSQQGVTGLFTTNYDNTAQSLKHKEDINTAIKEKNIFAFKNLKADEFFNFITSGIQNNRFEVRKLQLEMMKELPNEELNKLFQIPDGSRESNHGYIDELIAKAEQLKTSSEALSKVFSNPYNYKGNPQFDEHKEENKAWYAFEDYRNALMKMSYNMSDFNQRLGSIQNKISEIHPALINELVSNLTDPRQLSNLKVEYKKQANELSEQLDKTIKRSDNPELYRKTREQIKAFETHAEDISSFLESKDLNKLPKLFSTLSNFEANNQDPLAPSVINPLHNSDLMNYGHDINQLNQGRDFASATYDHLFTQEGYEDFLKHHDEWAKGLSLAHEETKVAEEKEIDVNGKPYEVNREYKTNIENRYTNPNGTNDLKNPFGEVIDTFKTKETVEQARDEANANIENKLKQVTILSKDGKDVLVRDSNGDIQRIDPRYLNTFEKLKSEEEIVTERADFYKDLEDSIDKESVTNPDVETGINESEKEDREPAKKAKEIVNRSTTFNVTSTKDYYQRQKSFFANFDRFPKEVKDNAKLIFVTTNNQEALGLNGLIEKMLEGGYENVYPIKDNKLTPIVAVFVKQNKDKFEYLDAEGKVVEPTLDNIVMATMPIAKEKYLSGEESPWRNDVSKEYIEADNKAWQNQRDLILSNITDSPEMYNFTISRGNPILDFTGEKLNYNSVVDILINKGDLSKLNLLQVSNGQIVVADRTIPIANGKVVLVNGNTVESLNNRTFTEQETDNIFKILKSFVKEANHTGKINKEILTYLRGIIYWQQLEKDETGKIKSVGKNQVYVSNGSLHIGTEFKVPFTTKAITDNEQQIKDAFQTIYTNANSKYIQNNNEFRELYINDQNELKTLTWANYQSYLLSNKYNIQEEEHELFDKTRDSALIPFRTPIKALNSNVPFDSNYEGKYAIITNSVSENAPLFVTNLKEVPKAKTETISEEVEPIKETKKVGSIDFSGKPDNEYQGISFGVIKNTNGENIITLFSDEQGNYTKLVTSLLTNPTQDFKEYLDYFKESVPTKSLVIDYLREQIENHINAQAFEKIVTSITTQIEEKIEKQAEEIKKEEVKKPSGKDTNIAPEDVNDLDLGDWNEQAFRAVLDASNYVQHNLTKSEVWFKENIPVDGKRLNHLIQVTGGGYAWGRYFNRVAEWYVNAKKGTIEHEGFEAIWGDFATLKERLEAKKEFNARKGSFISSEDNRIINYSEANEHEIKEELAEELGRYVLDGELYSQPKQGQNTIYRLFKKFVDFIKSILGIEFSKIKQMFDKINTGYYKTVESTTETNNPQYSILNLTESASYNIVRGITYSIMGELFNNNRNLIEFDEVGTEHAVTDLYNKVLKNIQNVFTVKVPELLKAGRINEVQFASFNKVWESIKADNTNVNRLVEEYLKTFNIIADLSGESILDEEVEKEADKESDKSEYAGKNADSYVTNQFKIDSKKSASASVKLLIATLPETTYVDKNDKTKGTKPQIDTTTLMPKMVNYNKTFNFLLNQLATLNTWEEKEKQLIELGKDYPNYVALAKRLKVGQSNVDADTWTLRTRFFNVMSKQKPDALVHYIGKTDDLETGSRVRSLNNNQLTRTKAQEWLDTLKLAINSPNNTVKIDENENYVFDGRKIASNPLKDAIDKIRYLNDINIPFTNQMYNKLSDTEKTEFGKTVINLANGLKNKNGVIEITPGKLGQAGNFIKIAKLFLKTNEESNSTYSNLDGEKQQQFVGNNFISSITNDINNSTSRDDLQVRVGFLDNSYRKDSIYFSKELFNENGDKTGKELSIGFNQGISNTAKDTETVISKMTNPIRLIEQINMNLQKNYYLLVPADSSTEWILQMEHVIPFERFHNPDINDAIYRIFAKYYKTERLIATKADGSLDSKYKSSMYNPAFNDDYATPDLLKNKFITYIDKNVDSIIEYLKDNNIITSNRNRPDQFVIKDLDTAFIKENGIGKSFSEQELKDFFKFTEVNYMINHIEMHKMFFGDPAMIKDPLKRYKSFFSPRETVMYNSPELNRSLNDSLNRAGNIVLTKNDYGYWEHKDFIPTITLTDLVSSELSILEDKYVKQYHDDYSKTNPSDGQSWGFLPAYREILHKNGGRFDKEQEKLFQYVTALDRKQMYEDGYLNDNKDSKYYYKPSLKETDEKTIEKRYKGDAKFPIIKPIGSGITQEGNIFLDKTSLAPLSYSFVRGTTLAEHYIKMWKQGIGYAIMESGRKLGGQNPDEFYHKNGAVNKDKYKNIVNIPHRYYGVQQETAGSKTEGPLGSQLTKLAIVNLRDAGNASTEEIQKMVDRHNQALRNITNFGYGQLLKKLGIREVSDETGNYYTAPDKRKIEKLLKNELFKREAPQNLKEAISLDENGNFKLPFESLSNYQQIKDILYSFVDKLITKPKMSGGPKIQLSGTGFEVGGRTIKKIDGKDTLVSNGLKFYTAEYDEEGNRIKVNGMEVMLPMWFFDQIKNHPKWENKTEQEVLDYLNHTKEGRAILKGTGFRIPTQELNSVESFTVKVFLPRWVGDTVVLPEAITTKSGGDFDVDKLNTYLKNIYVEDITGDIKLVPFGKNITQKSLEDLDVWQDSGTKDEALEELFGGDITKISNPIDKLYAQSLQNEYFDSLNDLILHPKNYERLIKPNSAQLGKDLRAELEVIAPKEFEGSKDKSILNRQYMSNMRHLFLIGKAWVGISASSQTNNALNQSTQIVINPDKINTLQAYEQKYIGQGNILLPHNKISFEGKMLPTLSRTTDTVGEYISDKISRYIDGPVDIAKDPWVTQLFQNTASFSTALFLEKLGVPDKTVVFFINQPIIREYIKMLEDKPSQWLYNDRNIKEILSKFNVLPQVYKNNTLLNPISINEIETKSLKGNIEKFYAGKKLTQDENERQKTILYEFLKYSILANHLFQFQRATSYDTNSQAQPNQQFRKTNLLNAAFNTNIITDMGKLLNATSLGEVVDKVQKGSKAIDQSFSVYDDNVRSVLNQVLGQLPSAKLNFEKAARAVEESFLTFMVQTNLGLNNKIKDLLLQSEQNVAKRVWEIKKDLVKNHPNSNLAQNKILQELISTIGNKKNDIKNVTIAQKATDIFTADVYTNAFRELRDNPLTQELYSDLLDLSLLQSGLAQSPISFSKYIPYEDYANKIADIIRNVKGAPNLQNFVDTGSFFRNSWKNKDIVPNMKEEFRDNGISKNRLGSKWFNDLKKEKGIEDNGYQIYKVWYTKGIANNTYITFEQNLGIDENGNDLTRNILLQRVEDKFGNPILLHEVVQQGYSSEGGNYMYVPINPWGDGIKLQEHYNEIRPSVVLNKGYAIKQEISMQEIVNAYNNRWNTKEENIEPNLDISEKSVNIANTDISKKIDDMIDNGEIKPKC